MYIYICIYIIHTHIQMNAFSCIHIHVYTYIDTWNTETTHVWKYVCIYTKICIHIHVYIYTYIHIHVYTYTRIYIYAYFHTWVVSVFQVSYHFVIADSQKKYRRVCLCLDILWRLWTDLFSYFSCFCGSSWGII